MIYLSLTLLSFTRHIRLNLHRQLNTEQLRKNAIITCASTINQSINQQPLSYHLILKQKTHNQPFLDGINDLTKWMTQKDWVRLSNVTSYLRQRWVPRHSLQQFSSNRRSCSSCCSCVVAVAASSCCCCSICRIEYLWLNCVVSVDTV